MNPKYQVVVAFVAILALAGVVILALAMVTQPTEGYVPPFATARAVEPTITLNFNPGLMTQGLTIAAEAQVPTATPEATATPAITPTATATLNPCRTWMNDAPVFSAPNFGSRTLVTIPVPETPLSPIGFGNSGAGYFYEVQFGGETGWIFHRYTKDCGNGVSTYNQDAYDHKIDPLMVPGPAGTTCEFAVPTNAEFFETYSTENLAFITLGGNFTFDYYLPSNIEGVYWLHTTEGEWLHSSWLTANNWAAFQHCRTGLPFSIADLACPTTSSNKHVDSKPYGSPSGF